MILECSGSAGQTKAYGLLDFQARFSYVWQADWSDFFFGNALNETRERGECEREFTRTFGSLFVVLCILLVSLGAILLYDAYAYALNAQADRY